MANLVKESQTKIQHDTRKAVLIRLRNLVETCQDDEDFYTRAWNDFPVWCAAFINDDSNKPMFPALWQIEYARMMGLKKYVWTMCSRKVGKSTLLAVKNVHDICGPVPKRVICFAPTLKQDFVFDKMGKYIEKSSYLYEVYVGGKGSITKDYIELVNGSSCQNKTIGLATKGELVRGEYGDIVTVDEVQKIEEQVMRQVIRPIIADAYSEKKFRMIGTPNLMSNPNLKNEWDAWIKESRPIDSESGFMCVDWKRGVLEGCLDRKYVSKEREGMTPDEFAMEYEARFPDIGSRYFDSEILAACVDPESKFRDEGSNAYDYAMAVDWATYVNKTQIVVGEYDDTSKLLKYVYWREIDPKVNRIDYENQINIVKNLFWKFRCTWLCPDATSNQDALIRMLVNGENSIPQGFLYKTGDRLGYCASDVLNDQMWRNHKQQMVKGRIKVPVNGAKELLFRENFRKEHNELDVKVIRNGNMIKLVEPDHGYKDLAVSCAMLSLYIQIREKGKPYYGMDGW